MAVSGVLSSWETEEIKLVFHSVRIGKLVCHMIDRRTQIADLIVAVMLYSYGKISLCKFCRYFAYLLNRFYNGTDKIKSGKCKKEKYSYTGRCKITINPVTAESTSASETTTLTALYSEFIEEIEYVTAMILSPLSCLPT